MKNKKNVCLLIEEFASLFSYRPGRIFVLSIDSFRFVDEDLCFKFDNKEFIYQQLFFDLIGAGINLDVNTLAIEEFKTYIKFLSRCIYDNNRTPF